MLMHQPNISHRIHGAGKYANIWGILMGFMSPYMAAPWIRHGYEALGRVFVSWQDGLWLATLWSGRTDLQLGYKKRPLKHTKDSQIRSMQYHGTYGTLQKNAEPWNSLNFFYSITKRQDKSQVLWSQRVEGLSQEISIITNSSWSLSFEIPSGKLT